MVSSMAAGYVSAAAGIYLGYHQNATAPQIKTALSSSVIPDSTLTGRVSSGGFLNISRAIAMDPSGAGVIPDSGDAELFDISLEAESLLNSGTLYTEMTEIERDLIRDTFFVRIDTMTACAEKGLTIRESIRKAIIMQRLNISIDDTLRMIENMGGEASAYEQAEYFTNIQYDYGWYSYENTEDIIKYIVEGYPTRNVIFAYIVARAFDLDLGSIIIKEAPELREMEYILSSVLNINLPEQAERNSTSGGALQLDEANTDEVINTTGGAIEIG